MLPSRAAGFSLFEILLVLGLASVFVAAGLIAYPQVRDNNYTNNERQRLLNILAVLRPLYGSTYASLTTDAANQARAFDPATNQGNYQAGQAIHHSWGGAVEVGPAANSRFLQITYASVPPDPCVKLSTGVARNFQRVTAGSVVVWDETMGLNQDVAQVVAACNADPVGVDMVFQAP